MLHYVTIRYVTPRRAKLRFAYSTPVPLHTLFFLVKLLILVATRLPRLLSSAILPHRFYSHKYIRACLHFCSALFSMSFPTPFHQFARLHPSRRPARILSYSRTIAKKTTDENANFPILINRRDATRRGVCVRLLAIGTSSTYS